ncbi:MAG: hypothetical protein K8S99_18570 [Planctomycetes bacterium]|nr:hypothetical protein [Planctomycetota bacterium]
MKQTTPSHSTHHRTPHRRGAVMSEMVLVLPLILLILALLIFFGYGMVRVQHSQVMDRYEAWRAASHTLYNEPGGSSLTVSRPPNADDTNAHQLLNETFFANNASSITHSVGNSLSGDATEELISRTSGFSADAGNVARAVYNSLPDGRTDEFHVTHANTVRALEMLNNDISHAHTRTAHDWLFNNGWVESFYRWNNLPPLYANQMQQIDDHVLLLQRQVGMTVQTVRNINVEAVVERDEGYVTWTRNGPIASPLNGVSEELYSDMDQGLESLSGQGNGLAGAIRAMYLNNPAYVGPFMGYQPEIVR